MKITLASIYVNDQDKALSFYTDILGFEKKTEIPMGAVKWLTVSSPAGAPGVELVLEPNHYPAAAAYQAAIYQDSIPATSFAASSVQAEYERLLELGVEFRTKPTPVGETTIAVFEDTCGNLIQIHEE